MSPRSTFLRDVAPSNTYAPIVFKPDAMNPSSDEHPSNAWSPTDKMCSELITPSNLEHPRNMLSPIPVTPSPKCTTMDFCLLMFQGVRVYDVLPAVP